MEFQAGILRKCTKLYTSGVALLVDPPTHVDKIKEIAKDTDIREFDSIFTRSFELENQNFDEMIEKIVILTHMFSTEFQKYMDCGQGPELMEHMWNGHFIQEDGNVANAFENANQSYRQQLTNFWFGELERVKHMPASGRQFIEEYDTIHTRIDKKLDREYRFVANPKKEIMMRVNAVA